MRAALLIGLAGLAGAALFVGDAPAHEIEDIINQATLEEYQSYVRVLTGLEPVPGSDPPYYLTNRHSFGDEIHVAGQSNGVPDECDIAEGTSEDENGNGIPDEREFDCIANELAKLLASDGAPGDRFGYSVAISGDTAVIGAISADSAYVFRYDGAIWTEQARLAPSGGGNRFGCAVAVSGNVAAIRAYDLTYMFRFDGSTWVEEAELITPGGGHGFDKSVGISDDTAVVGAAWSEVAYVFRWNGSTWAEEATLVPSHGARAFGFSVAISEDTVVIGANLDDSAWVFGHDGSSWVEEAKLETPTPDGGDFGGSVSVSGDTIVVGGAHHASSAGAVYVFRYVESTWSEEAELLASDGVAYDSFGKSVSVSGNTAVIGAAGDDDNGDWSGSAYVFRYDGSGWVEEAKLLPSDGAPDDRLGYYSAAVSGDIAVIGAYGDDDNGDWSGSAYAFHGLSDCQPNGTIDICDITNGTSEDCQPNGVPDECDIANGTSEDNNGNGVPDECEAALGDLNCDGTVDEFDINPFVLALTDPEGYGAAWPDCDRMLADCNCDGVVDAFDIDPFVELLTGG